MEPLLKELSTLEVEPLEVIVSPPEPDSSLALLTTTPYEVEVATLLTGIIVAKGEACCCCCPCCCCSACCCC